MVISLYCGIPGFFNDVAEELRLFTDAAVLCAESPGEANVSVTLQPEGGLWHVRAACALAGQRAEYNQTYAAVSGSALVVKRYMKRYVKIAAFRMMRQVENVYTPWGSLTGIRPTRLLRELIGSMGEAQALAALRDDFDVSAGKIALAHEILRMQADIFATQTPHDLDVYIGIPFCASRCLYCSFLSQVRTGKTDMAAYLDALTRDIELGAQITRESGYRVRAVYVGGGTPTVLTAQELERVLACVQAAYGGFGRELTVEAGRSDTITAEKLQVIKRFGAQRICINPQSMNDATLARIGRSHSTQNIREAFDISREIGFDSINMDIICALPGEGLPDIRRTLEAVRELAPENLTVHTLALKRSSMLKERLDEYPLPDAAAADEMVALGGAFAREMGMRPYYMYRQKYMRGNLENVGYALEGKECIYNVDMMEETTAIMAHGAGAMTKRVFERELRAERIPNPKDIATYIAKVDTLAERKRALFLE